MEPLIACTVSVQLASATHGIKTRLAKMSRELPVNQKTKRGGAPAETEPFANVYQSADVSYAFTNPPAVRMSVLGPNAGLRDILTSCDVSLFLPATAGLYCKSSETEANPS